jgi:hypothetical protein
MAQQDQGAEHTTESGGLTRRELNAFLATSSLAGALLMLVVWVLIPRVLAPLLELPRPVWLGLGFLVLSWSLYPALRAHARLGRPPRILSWKRYLVGSLVGSGIGALVSAGLQKIWL